MDERFYRDRARVLRDLAGEADPLIKLRLLRLANNYDGMTTTEGTQRRGKGTKQAAADGRGSDER